MNLGQLVDAYRGDADDRKLPYFATDEDLIDYANEAQEQACVRASLLLDSTTSGITSLAFTAGGSPVLALDPRVISIRRVMWSGRTLPLLPRLTARMDEEYPGWEAHTGQEPSLYVTDVSTRAIRIYPIPLVSGTLRLSVYRYPLDPMVDLGDEPEIRVAHHRGLVQWMLFRVFSRPDADHFDADKADRTRKLFIQQFGEERSARNEAWRSNEMTSLPDPLC